MYGRNMQLEKPIFPVGDQHRVDHVTSPQGATMARWRADDCPDRWELTPPGRVLALVYPERWGRVHRR